MHSILDAHSKLFFVGLCVVSTLLGDWEATKIRSKREIDIRSAATRPEFVHACDSYAIVG